ncbi:hypothetical protein PM082_015153 [Marasmius tenuissimus]|nr:hypothetical protein PM082_015153 [Marasmius tenuissimus]
MSAKTLSSSQSSLEGVIVTHPAGTPVEKPEPNIVLSDTLGTSQPPNEPVTPLPQEDSCDNQNHRDIVVRHRATTAWADRTWGNGKSGWGNGDELDSSPWGGLQSPKIVSLTVGQSWSDATDDGVFRWCTLTHSGNPSHWSIVLYVQPDIHTILKPLGDSKSSVLRQAPSDKWAQTMIIHSLPEAQHASVPGPEFTLTEVAERLSQVNADITAAQVTISKNLARINDIRNKQEPLRAYL